MPVKSVVPVAPPAILSPPLRQRHSISATSQRKVTPTSPSLQLSCASGSDDGDAYDDAQSGSDTTDSQLSDEEEQQSEDDYDDVQEARNSNKSHRNSAPAAARGPSAARRGDESTGNSSAPAVSIPADQQSIIVCGVLAPGGSSNQRIFMEDSSYFGCSVDVYTALDDPQQRTLYRASALAHKFHVATNQVRMRNEQ
jgi:hypothetical protein